ncbi:MAG: YjbH domain-containing protein [Pseudomonadota bacterium]
MALPAQAEMWPTLNFSGVTGVIDMPSGEPAPDGTLSLTSGSFGPITHTTLSFQLAPRLSGSFRYSAVRDWNYDGLQPFETYYDRSFDLRYQVLRETRYLPSVTVGLQDFIGTGLSSGEYVAATKTIAGKVKVTAGLGWGRLGSYGSIGSPLGQRPGLTIGVGGKVNTGQWFKGPAAPFAGVEWQANDRWTLKAEYSSDAYVEESGTRGTFDRSSPFNFGVEYQHSQTLRFGLYSMYGSEIGAAVHLTLNPKRRIAGEVTGPAPVQVALRSPATAGWSDAWVSDDRMARATSKALATRLAVDGMGVEALSVTQSRAQLRLRNPVLDNGPQAIGRAARAMSHVLPASVEVFEIVPVVNGIALSKVTIRRSDLEALEHAPNNDKLLQDRITVTEAGRLPAGALGDEGLYPRFTWRLSPYAQVSYFDPSRPFRIDVGARLSARYEITPGLILSGSVIKKVAGNLGDGNRPSNSKLQHVRSDADLYFNDGDPALERLTLAWYARPGDALYSRVTVGYLERMHAGVSAEMLWKPVGSRLALGVEANYTRQRDTDGGLGVGQYDYGVASGLVSAYYTFGDGYIAQVDVGRYLAGDTGATIAMDREFANGVKVGAFASFTNVSAKTFGEGSFDKGIRVTIPLNWLLAKPTRRTFGTTIRPVQRDGGARLDVQGRLYDTVRDYHKGRLDDQWGRVWR